MKGLAHASVIVVLLGLLWQSSLLQRSLELIPGLAGYNMAGEQVGGPALGPQYKKRHNSPALANDTPIPSPTALNRHLRALVAVETQYGANPPHGRVAVDPKGVSADSVNPVSALGTTAVAQSLTPLSSADRTQGEPAVDLAQRPSPTDKRPTLGEDIPEDSTGVAPESESVAEVSQKPAPSMASTNQTQTQAPRPTPITPQAEKPSLSAPVGQSAATSQSYTIHVASYLASSSWGSRVLSEIRGQVPDAFLSPVTVKGREYFRLLVGHFPTNASAKKRLDQLLAAEAIPEGSVLRLRYTVEVEARGDCAAVRQRIIELADQGMFLSPQRLNSGECRLLSGAFSSEKAAQNYWAQSVEPRGKVVER